MSTHALVDLALLLGDVQVNRSVRGSTHDLAEGQLAHRAQAVCADPHCQSCRRPCTGRFVVLEERLDVEREVRLLSLGFRRVETGSLVQDRDVTHPDAALRGSARECLEHGHTRRTRRRVTVQVMKLGDRRVPGRDVDDRESG